jgi:gamma-glutamyltranspeptidase/glutathione hydrolase
VGSPGGPTIFTTVFQVIVNVLDHGLPIQQAVAAPRFHHQWPPLEKGKDVVRCEQGIDAKGLEQLGYAIERKRIGDVQAIQLEGSRATGASDPRGTGAVATD